MMRKTLVLLTAGAALGGIGLAGWHPAPRLIWNASASVPIGLYSVQPTGSLHVNELLVVRPPDAIARLLDAGGYLPRGVPMLKHVAALPGQTVCREGLDIVVDNTTVGVALIRDHLGRPLPYWQGCRVLRQGEVFLMNRHVPASLDGRYFGPLPDSAIVGRAVPIWLPEGH